MNALTRSKSIWPEKHSGNGILITPGSEELAITPGLTTEETKIGLKLAWKIPGYYALHPATAYGTFAL